jgi:uncharacterized protein (DUF2235 family)
MKRLVLCCDGTWNRADQEIDDVPCPTNVVRLALRVAKRDGATAQVIYYDQGVGTGNVVDRLSGGAFGEGLEENIHDAYRFLVADYEPGDEIFLFGFSRGAFTVRSLAGMIRKCGILRRESVHHYRAAVQLYRDANRPDTPVPMEFREKHSLSGPDPIDIRFLGVWDTVGALGIPLRGLRWLTRREHQFHDTELSKSVRFAYHALAIDERRAPFQPTLWTYKPKPGQAVEQVWFCGAHSDVGGGYRERGLSDLALEWIVAKASAVGLALDSGALNAYPLSPNCMDKVHNSRRGFYRLAPGTERTIGLAGETQDPTQCLHQSVRDRWDRDPDYRLASLRPYFRMTGDARG